MTLKMNHSLSSLDSQCFPPQILHHHRYHFLWDYQRVTVLLPLHPTLLNHSIKTGEERIQPGFLWHRQSEVLKNLKQKNDMIDRILIVDGALRSINELKHKQWLEIFVENTNLQKLQSPTNMKNLDIALLFSFFLVEANLETDNYLSHLFCK